MTDTFEDCLVLARTELKRARALIQTEISAYPAPIAGCDVQFNHLLAARQQVLTALCALDEAVFVPTPRSPTPHAGVESR